jgi:hypothetical protein
MKRLIFFSVLIAGFSIFINCGNGSSTSDLSKKSKTSSFTFPDNPKEDSTFISDILILLDRYGNEYISNYTRFTYPENIEKANGKALFTLKPIAGFKNEAEGKFRNYNPEIINYITWLCNKPVGSKLFDALSGSLFVDENHENLVYNNLKHLIRTYNYLEKDSFSLKNLAEGYKGVEYRSTFYNDTYGTLINNHLSNYGSEFSFWCRRYLDGSFESMGNLFYTLLNKIEPGTADTLIFNENEYPYAHSQEFLQEGHILGILNTLKNQHTDSSSYPIPMWLGPLCIYTHFNTHSDSILDGKRVEFTHFNKQSLSAMSKLLKIPSIENWIISACKKIPFIRFFPHNDLFSTSDNPVFLLKHYYYLETYPAEKRRFFNQYIKYLKKDNPVDIYYEFRGTYNGTSDSFSDPYYHFSDKHLLFWMRRLLDGSYAEMGELLTKLSSVLAPEETKKAKQFFKEAPVESPEINDISLLTHVSYSDQMYSESAVDLTKNTFSCRDLFLQRYSDILDNIYSDNSSEEFPAEKQMKADSLISRCLQSIQCKESDASFVYYCIDTNRLKDPCEPWANVPVVYSAKSYYPGDQLVMYVDFYPVVPGLKEQPQYFIRMKQKPSTPPRGFIRPKIIDETSSYQNDNSITDLKYFHYAETNCFSFPFQLKKHNTYKKQNENRELYKSQIWLYPVNDRDSILLAEENSTPSPYGEYSVITDINPILCDINGDNKPDIIYEINDENWQNHYNFILYPKER